MKELPTVGIFVAIKVEYDAVLDQIENVSKDPRNGENYRKGIISTDNSDWEVILKQTEQGNENASGAVANMNGDFPDTDFDLMLLLGTAGGIKDVELGDIAVASNVELYEYGSVEDDRFYPREKGQEATRKEDQCALSIQQEGWRNYCDDPDCPGSHNTEVATIASGSKVVKSDRSRTYELLKRDQSDCIAVEMEAGGFYEGAKRVGVPRIAILGTSDIIPSDTHKKEAESKGFMRIASDHAMSFATKFLEELPLYRDDIFQVTRKNIGSDIQELTDAELTSRVLNADWTPSHIRSIEPIQSQDANVVKLETSDGFPAIGIIRAEPGTGDDLKLLDELTHEIDLDRSVRLSKMILAPEMTHEDRKELRTSDTTFINVSEFFER